MTCGLVSSDFSAVRSKSPFFVSASWHSTQCFSSNGGTAAAAVETKAKARSSRTKDFITGVFLRQGKTLGVSKGIRLIPRPV